ncbi:DUF1553 domain-containing protein [Ochrovirga pacifica]|uniref:DUF1553 domain-containing protein n=1 Tax=Ochrovirga pacifica TaxID=1042376 RepID=UPI0002559AF5|nr:DUF1553 domain-containing protein [Ochrovirga pacifica]
MKKTIFGGVVALSLVLLSCNEDSKYKTTSKLPDEIDYNFHVRPILSDKCFLCHGPDKAKQKANLRLDTYEGATAQRKDGSYPIYPNKSEKSEIIRRMTTKDTKILMPPVDSHLSMTDGEIAIISKWIDQGAKYEKHWSFAALEKVEVPKVDLEKWPKNEIDHFVAKKLEQNGLTPSEKASKETLIRRLSFNLTGLPPTLEEIDDFVNDTSEDAYEKVVDSLLSDYTYGERMTAEWLDVARFADSDGYLDDKHRDFSPWRTWVINAFNQNKSYKDFVTEQIAGDLLPNATQETTLATAFNRLHRKNSEAGIIFEEFRVEAVADRTNTFGKAFLGLTMECARCHDHKYDPISQKNYFELFGFFNSTHEIGTAVYGPGQVPGPSLLLTSDEKQKVLDYLNNEIETQEDQLHQEIASSNQTAFKTWSQNTNQIKKSVQSEYRKHLIADYPLNNFKKLPHSKKSKWEKKSVIHTTSSKLPNQKEARITQGIFKKEKSRKAAFIDNYTKITIPKPIGKFDHMDAFSVSFDVYLDTIYEEAGIMAHSEGRRNGLKGYSMFLENNKPKFIIARSWPQNAIEAYALDSLPTKEWINLTVTYDGSAKSEGIHLFVNGKSVPVKRNGQKVYKTLNFKPNIHTYGFKGFVLGASNGKPIKNGGYSNLKIFNKQLSPLEVAYNYEPNQLNTLVANQEFVEDFYLGAIDNNNLAVNQKLKELRTSLTKELDSIPEIMVMGDLPEPRPTYILNRGNYDSPEEEELSPNTPESILEFDKKFPRNRLGLTQWLFDEKNPLASRVFVNRIWQMHFGKGLVKTSDDFGNQGDLPTHPELLDWLSKDFMESGWDIKKLHKKIVMSATYQQSSKVKEELLKMDSDNKLLARAPSNRFTAEMVRDNALKISGLLVNKLGGESVYPYQPKGLWSELTTKKWRYKYKHGQNEGLYRRSIYSVWKRSSPPPTMLIFDAPDRGVCTVNRRQTSTPLQALVLLNDPHYLEAARVLAEKLVGTTDTIDSKLTKAFRLATGRTPNKKESEIIKEFYQTEFDKFTKTPNDAIAYLSTGTLERNKALDPVKTAALANVINGIMNTTEGYTLK